MPRAVLFGGVNGSGKTTFARHLLPSLGDHFVFLNADEIRRELGPDASSIEAGRLLLKRLRLAVIQRQAFGLETTLSSRGYAQAIPRWRAAGYSVTLHFLELPTIKAAIERVAKRVAAGGHHIPDDDIKRRFGRSLENFHLLYKTRVDVWYHYRADQHGMRLIDQSYT